MAINDNIWAGLAEGVRGVLVPYLQAESEEERKRRLLQEEARLSVQKSQALAPFNLQQEGLKEQQSIRLKREAVEAARPGEVEQAGALEAAKVKARGGTTGGGLVDLYDEEGNIIAQVPKGSKPAPRRKEAKPPTAAESTTGLYANRLEQGNKIISKLEKYAASANPLAFGSQKGLPDWANFLKQDEFQSLEQAQRNFLNATLRRESGAVISPSEFAEGQRQYFPMPGDAVATIKQKKANRDLVLQQFIKSAGSGYERSPILNEEEAPPPATTGIPVGSVAFPDDPEKQKRYEQWKASKGK